MREVELSRIDERIRQLLRAVSELEEKYSLRGPRLLRDPNVVEAGPEEARGDLERLAALYAELVRLMELRASYPRGRGRAPATRPEGVRALPGKTSF